MCPEPRADGEAKAETQRTLPPLRVRGRFPGWSKAPARLSASRAEKRPSSLGWWERPYFPKPAASLDPVTPASTPRSRLSCLEISEPPGETQSGGSPFCSRETASQRCAFPLQRLKPRCGGAPLGPLPTNPALLRPPAIKLNIQKLRSWHLVPSLMANRWGNNGNSDRLYFGGLQNHCKW